MMHDTVMTARELLKILKSDGWKLDRQEGSHRVFLHPTKPNAIVVPFHKGGTDVPFGTLQSLLKKAGLK